MKINWNFPGGGGANLLWEEYGYFLELHIEFKWSGDILNGIFFCSKGITVTTMKGILEEMMTLFPDQFFHLGLDEVTVSSLCTIESKSEFIIFFTKLICASPVYCINYVPSFISLVCNVQ